MFIIILLHLAVFNGICSANLLINGTEGESVKLPSVLGTVTWNDFVIMEWYFNNREIVKGTRGKDNVNLHDQFTGRLQLSPDFSLTIKELTLQDSGMYQRTGLMKNGSQIPSHTISLRVYESVKAVKILQNITWVPVNETCEVHVMCSSSGDQSASYTWRKGDQTVRGRELHFSLSPAEGGVTVTCTVHYGVSEKSMNDTVRCTSADNSQDLYLYIGAGVGAAVLVIIITAVLVSCFRRKRTAVEPVQEPMTTYAVVNKSSRRESNRSEGHNNSSSLYETVGEVNIQKKPETLYDQVMLNRHTESSPYQKVL
ncbi:SLAM family member 6-like isoform X1 [Scleropages formosus]|uniref:SLAM family member 6-like n=1 Tax=Scleropages formosus TaxID=113540 RepID=A0A8C9V5V9_SCLFO|nr:SLAM family member 6-like isoform X1 [Scleropages formosus]